MVSIRQAAASDAGLLKDLIHEFAAFQRMKAIVTEDALLRDGFGPRPHFRALIAEWKTEPAAYALFFDYYSTFQGGAGIFLEDVYVRDQFRGKRIGKALFAHLAMIALREDCVGIMFNVLDWNNGAIDFYRSLGATFLDHWKTISLERASLQNLAQL